MVSKKETLKFFILEMFWLWNFLTKLAACPISAPHELIIISVDQEMNLVISADAGLYGWHPHSRFVPGPTHHSHGAGAGRVLPSPHCFSLRCPFHDGEQAGDPQRNNIARGKAWVGRGDQKTEGQTFASECCHQWTTWPQQVTWSVHISAPPLQKKAAGSPDILSSSQLWKLLFLKKALFAKQQFSNLGLVCNNFCLMGLLQPEFPRKKKKTHQSTNRFLLSPFKHLVASQGLSRRQQVTGIWTPEDFKGPCLERVEEETKHHHMTFGGFM